jgi:hypothetical protein
MSQTVLYMSMSIDGLITGTPKKVRTTLSATAGSGFTSGSSKAAGTTRTNSLGGSEAATAKSSTSSCHRCRHRGTRQVRTRRGLEGRPSRRCTHLHPQPQPDTRVGGRRPAVHYVSELEVAVRDARQTAGDKDVLVHGASIAQRALTAGLLDDLEVHLIPVRLGDGRRLFEHLGIEQRPLECIRVLEGEDSVTHLR